jgi:hypothetical protein
MYRTLFSNLKKLSCLSELDQSNLLLITHYVEDKLILNRNESRVYHEIKNIEMI